MNDHRLPPDELASAFLDGELTADEAEAVRQDPDLAARADALRRATEAVGEAVGPPPGAAGAAVQAALTDFDARRHAPADMRRRRPRGSAVITGVAAAVAVGFIVAAAIALFAQSGGDDADTAAAPAAAPPPAAAPAFDEQPAAAEAAAAAAELPPPPASPEPAPAPPPPATSAPQPDLLVAPMPAPEFAAESEPLDVEPGAALAAAQAEADAARAGAVESAPPPPAAAPPPPPAEDTEVMADEATPTAARDVTEPSPEEACAGAIAGRTVELRLSVGGTPILILGTPETGLTTLDGTTCAEIPPPDDDEMIADEAPDGCAGAIAGGTVELRFALSGTRLLVVRTADGSLSGLDGTTCAEIPPG